MLTVNDLRDRRPPLQRSNSGRPGTSSSAARSIRTAVEAETLSAQPHYPGGIRRRRHSNAGLPNLASRITGQQNVPSRTTKISEKLVLIPSTSGEESADCRPQEELEQGPKQTQAEGQQSVRGDVWDGETLRGDTWAERLGKAHRGERLARVTAYCTAQAMKLKATAEFIKTKHEARTKLYDDCLYVIYHIPLLPGIDGYRIRSRPVLVQPGSKKSFLDLMIERGERGDHYESDLELYGTSPELANGASMVPGAQSQLAVPRMETQIDIQRKTISNPLLPSVREYAEMFVFSYGVVVLWNFSEAQERDVLADLTFAEVEDPKNNNATADKLLVDTGKRLPANTTAKISLMTRPLADSDVETEEFHFQYSEDVRKPRVFNDMITLMPRSDHMVKLTISHAIAQSTKLCYFEERMNETMSSCENVPKVLAKTGELKMDRTEVLRMMGKLYKNRVDINLSSNVLDVPNFFWDSEPVLQPLYGAIRDYLEIDSRIEKLNAKAEVFLDLATILSDSVADTKMSNITIIIIVLIVISIFVTIAETSMRFNILQKGKSGQRGEESDAVSGDDDNGPGISRNGGNDVDELADLIRGKHRIRMAAYQLANMTPDQRMVWAGNLSADEKAKLCGSDVICRTFAGI